MALEVQQQGDHTRIVVKQPSVEYSSGDGKGQKKPSRHRFVSQISMEPRGLQVCVYNMAAVI